jgi:hypothetical protein
MGSDERVTQDLICLLIPVQIRLESPRENSEHLNKEKFILWFKVPPRCKMPSSEKFWKKSCTAATN